MFTRSVLVVLSGFLFSLAGADELTGDWTLKMESGNPGWLSIAREEGKAVVRMRVHVGSDGPHTGVTEEDGRLSFTMRQNKKAKGSKTVEVGLKDGKLEGVLIVTSKDGVVKRDPFVGKKMPPMPAAPPDLEKVKFGVPVSIFNGKDLTGWRPHEADKINGWGVKDGLLVNTTPKTDFSATGAYANLRTEAVYEDFRLHIEFLIEEGRNSGVYLRGMYEAQVVDRDSRMQGVQGVGSIFGRIAPSKNAGKKGGEWQSYDLTLVDRHVTVVLNGEKVIDNQPVHGPTGGAVFTDPTQPGPIHLQGDHTSVAYRNITLAPVIKD
ncbi:MAG: 3-keto-disaccharide hydrolase [Verrucomicrobiaceae bacterium]